MKTLRFALWFVVVSACARVAFGAPTPVQLVDAFGRPYAVSALLPGFFTSTGSGYVRANQGDPTPGYAFWPFTSTGTGFVRSNQGDPRAGDAFWVFTSTGTGYVLANQGNPVAGASHWLFTSTGSGYVTVANSTANPVPATLTGTGGWTKVDVTNPITQGDVANAGTGANLSASPYTNAQGVNGGNLLLTAPVGVSTSEVVFTITVHPDQGGTATIPAGTYAYYIMPGVVNSATFYTVASTKNIADAFAGTGQPITHAYTTFAVATNNITQMPYIRQGVMVGSGGLTVYFGGGGAGVIKIVCLKVNT